MLKFLKNKVLTISRSSGIEATFLENGEISYSSICLSLKNNVLKKEIVIHSTKDPSQLGNSSIPVSLVCTGKGILVKKIVNTTLYESPIHAVFPQANPQEFYVQVLKLEEFTLISVARRSSIDHLINTLRLQGYKVINLTLGFLCIETIVPFTKDQLLTLSGCSLEIKNFKITLCHIDAAANYNPLTEVLLIDQYIQSSHILPFSAALNLFKDDLQQSPDIHNNIIQECRINFMYSKYFHFATISMAILLFFILLLNYFLYEHYYSKNQNANISKNITISNELKQRKIEEELQKKKNFLEEMGWGKPEKISLFADRFASFLPPSIWLTSIEFFPSRSSFISDHVNEFKKDTIILKAICTDAGNISVFINNIKTLKEIKEVNMKTYNYNREQQNGQFHLEIITK
jgi:hypothetical protein